MSLGYNDQAMLNLSGYIGRDAETRFTGTGKAVTTFTVPIEQRSGKNEKQTIWYRVQMWGDAGAKRTEELRKGNYVSVIGQLELSTYTNKEGKDVQQPTVTADPYSGVKVGPPRQARTQAMAEPYDDDLPD